MVILQNALDTERSTGAAPGELVSTDAGERRPTGPDRPTTSQRSRRGGSHQVSDLGLDLDSTRRARRRARSRRGASCLAVLLALAVLVGGGFVAYSYGLTALKDKLSPPADYEGSGTGKVLVQVRDGDSSADIAATLRGKGVVKSREAFTDAARDNPKSVGIQVGFYELKRRLPAKSALTVLLEPENRIRSVGDGPRGAAHRPDRRAAGPQDEVLRAAVPSGCSRSPARLGLPSYAQGNPEGYLFPATYELSPDSTPRSILRSMVARYEAAVSDLGLTRKADALGYSVHDVMTVASIVQAEGRRAATSRRSPGCIYNRLEKRKPLQLDTTIVYIFKTKGKLTTSSQQRAVGLAVQHLPQHRAAADADRGAGGEGDRRRRCAPTRRAPGCTS